MKGIFHQLFAPALARDERERIEDAIARAESKTKAEIHIRLITHARGRDIVALAEKTFHRMGLDQNEGRHDVLILISRLDHLFAIWGDRAIHAKAGHPLWERAAKALQERLAAGEFAEGLLACVAELGPELARHFPR